MDKRIAAILDLLNFLICFVFAKWVFMSYLFSYSITIFNLQAGQGLSTVVSLALILVISGFLFVLLRLLYAKTIKVDHLMALYGSYFLVLFYVLFFKNIGLQGHELNPLTYFDGVAYGYWFEPVMNLLLFIPLGFLLRLNWKSFILSLLVLLTIEGMQYGFHLGIFDVGDLLANAFSLLVGQGLRLLLLALGFRQWLYFGDSPKASSAKKKRMIYMENEMTALSIQEVLTAILILWNCLVFLAYGWDKYCAIKNHWRIPESRLLLLSFALGGLGALLGGILFHHKTRKWYFQLTWWVSTVLLLAVVYWLWQASFLKG